MTIDEKKAKCTEFFEKLSETKNIGPKAIDEINEKLVQSGFKPIVNEEEN